MTERNTHSNICLLADLINTCKASMYSE